MIFQIVITTKLKVIKTIIHHTMASGNYEITSGGKTLAF